MIRSLTFALGTGMFAAINPCGFALLPAYLSYFLGLESSNTERATDDGTRSVGVLRAVAVASTMSAGFLTVFGLIGVFWSGVVSQLHSPIITIVLGLLLACLGIAMLAGFHPSVSLPKVTTSKSTQTLASVFLFGVSYAVASLSCTLPLFSSVVVGASARDGVVNAILLFVAYSLGMATIVVVLTVAVATAQQGIINKMKRLIPHMNRISGALLVIAGLFVAYYGWYDRRVLSGDVREDRFISAAQRVQDWARSVIDSIGEVPILMGVVALIAVAVLIPKIRSRRRQHDHTTHEVNL